MISVALCTYNGEKYLRQQLDSILTQTMPVDEIVVVDDSSTDSTRLIVKEYAQKHSLIRLIQNPKNIGCRKNFERALKECRGDYIFFSDQDDLWHTDKVQVMVDYLRTTGMYGVFSDGQLIDEKNDRINNGTLFDAINLKDYIKAGFLSRYGFEILCFKGNYVTGAALAITREAKDVVLPFSNSTYMMHDTYMAVQLASIHKLGFIDKPLISYRIHSSQHQGLDMTITGGRESVFECLSLRGSRSELLAIRRHSSIPVHYCHLGRKARRQISDTYKRLYSESMSGDFLQTVKSWTLFFLNELYFHFRCKVGYREL